MKNSRLQYWIKGGRCLSLCFSLMLPLHSQAQQPRLGFSVSIPINLSSSTDRQLGEINACKINENHHRKSNQKPSYWKQVGDVLLATLVFGAVDYAFFNWMRLHEKGLVNYRVFQLATQVGLSAALFYRNGGPEQWKEGLKVAGAFNLMWWTFNADMVYYGIAELDTPGYWKGSVEPGSWEMRHAKWTPYGLGKSAFSGRKWGDTPFSETEIISQSITGLGLSAGLLALDFWDYNKTPVSICDEQAIESLSNQQNLKNMHGLPIASPFFNPTDNPTVIQEINK